MQSYETGKFTQASAKAGATIDTQNAKENQALAQLLQDPVGSGIADATGKPTDNASNIIMHAAPMSGADNYSKIVSAAQKKIEFNTSVNNLQASQRAEYGSMLSGAASAAKSPEELQGWNDAFLEQKKGTPSYDDFKRIANTSMQVVNHVDGKEKERGQIVPVGQEGWRTGAFSLGRQVLGASGIVGPGGIAQPQTGTMDNGAQIQPGAVAPALQGGGFTPGGPPVAKALGPTDQVPYRAAITKATATASGEADIDTKRAETVSTAAQNSSGQIQLTKQADRLVDMIQSGSFTNWTDKQRKEAGSDAPEVIARYELKKTLGALKSSATNDAGSDTRLASQLEQFPDETSPNEVVHSRMDSMRGTYRLFQERKDNLNSYQGKPHGISGFQLSDDHMTSRDPLTSELHSLPSGSKERRAFLTRNFKGNIDAMQDAIDRENASYHTVGNSGK